MAEWVVLVLLDIAAVIYLVVSRAFGIDIGELDVVGTLFLMNWGARFIDHAAFGVAPLSLSADSTHVRLRVRDVALRQALEEGARGEPRTTESARFELG